MLWLKMFDPLSDLIPGGLIVGRRTPPDERVCVVRPGGLGDLVVLTRCCRGLGLDLDQFDWMVEGRNAAWLDFLGVRYERYDTAFPVSALFPKRSYRTVVNTEQYHGLATVFSKRLVVRDGVLAGFRTNRRGDLCRISVEHEPHRRHEVESFRELFVAVEKYCGPFSRGMGRARAVSPRRANGVVVALGGLQSRDKRLPVSCWREILSRAASHGEPVLVVGSSRDRSFAEKVVRGCSRGVENLVGRIPFRDVVERIRNAVRVYGVDSGLIHVADYFEVPSEAVYPRENLVQWGPLTPGSVALSPELTPLHLPDRGSLPGS